MASSSPKNSRNAAIPLQMLARPPDTVGEERGHNRGRSILSAAGTNNSDTRYERLEPFSPSPPRSARVPPRLTPPRIVVPEPQAYEHEDAYGSPLSNAGDLQSAMGFAGLSIMGSGAPSPTSQRPLSTTDSIEFDSMSPYGPSTSTSDAHQQYFDSTDSDVIPLTDPHYLQPVAGTNATPRTSQDRVSFQSVHFTPDGRGRPSRLGDDLPRIEAQNAGRGRGSSFAASLSPHASNRSRSSSAVSPLLRAGSIMRAMSQRVVNLSNEFDSTRVGLADQASAAAREDQPSPGDLLHQDTTYQPHARQSHEKSGAKPMVAETPAISWPENNPFRGKSLLLFPPRSAIRIRLCDIIVHPLTEPAILLLIILQLILLTIEAAPNVYTNPRPKRFGEAYLDWIFLALFIVFTFEILARIIVSGLFFNAPEYSTIDREKGIKHAIVKKYQMVFAPHGANSIRHDAESATDPDRLGFQPSIMRSLTAINTTISAPTNETESRRLQLARRAFLRHSLTRLDFVAVVAFWIQFVLSVVGVEGGSHLYVFKMLSCLRIMRLLALTNGTSVILKSLKKAAPMLVNVSFLIGFFWLLFAIIGVQAFKSSFSRQCTWIDPTGQANYTNVPNFCGGFLDNITGIAQPWVLADGFTPAADSPKGYICPKGSVCMAQQGPYNGTVNFDNIVQSLELVFVIMSANTFSDLLYYTTNSDYLASALFFAAGIVIMMLWLTNLLIAVITSSFQVIREESKGESAFSRNVHQLGHHENEMQRRRSVLQSTYDSTAWVWILVIAFGLVTQACRSASMLAFRTSFLWWTETVVTSLLLLEICFRYMADWRHFFHKPQNCVDLAVAITTGIILLPIIRNSGQAYAWLSFFQIIRIYRVVWFVPITRLLIAKVLGNAAGIGNLVLFVFLITFLVAILACQLFRGDIPVQDSNGNIEITFSTVYNAFLGMYQILSSENWTTILYNVTTYQNYLNIGWIGATFLIGWFILAFFILVNMFIAVIQENFDVSEDEKRLHQVKAFLQKKDIVGASSNLSLSTIFQLGRSQKAKDPLDYGQAAMEMLLKDAVVKDFLDDEVVCTPLHTNSVVHTDDVERSLDRQKGYWARKWAKFKQRIWHREPNPFYADLEIKTTAKLDARAMAREALTAKTQTKRRQREFLARHPKYNKSLFIFKVDNPIRKMCQKIVGPGRLTERVEGVEPNKLVWYIFSAFIYACIVTMVVLACVTTPLYQREYFTSHIFSLKNWFVWTDLAFASIFTFEAIIKVVADGFFWTPNAYFRSLWGFIDGIVMITLWITVVSSFMNDGAVSRAVGAFKALRALRLLNVSDSARETFHSVIFVGGWRVISAAFVSLSLLIPFAIYGLNLFNGQMVSCNDSTYASLADCTGEWNSTPFSSNWTLLAPRVAANPYYNFDNFGDALFILFQIVSQEGWVDVMFQAESIVGRGLQPQAFASQGNAVFFVVFNLMATVFILTLFISVFMRTYTEQTGVAFLTAEQRSWLEMRKLLRHINPSKRPSNKTIPAWKTWCYKRATQKHGKWHHLITFILICHLVLLTIEFFPEPDWWDKFRNYSFLAFTVVYLINIAVRIIGLSWARFRRSAWDLYSLVSVIGTLTTTIVLLTSFQNTTYIRLHKLFLVSIALLLIPRNNALDQLFKTAAASLSKIGNLLATWFVLFLVYAIAMTQTFGLTRFGNNESNNINFRTVPKALIVLFRMSVGEGWNQIMEDFATIEPPFCSDDPSNFYNSDCGSSTWARTLFISWNILSMYIFVSLFVSLIFESFSYVYQRSSGLSIVTREEIRKFKQAWSMFDPHGIGYITKEQFPRLLGELSGVFGMRIYDDDDSVKKILEDCKLKSVGSRAGSVATPSAALDVDLDLLNTRIARIDSDAVRERRAKYNMFYQEVMVSADVDRGISFNAVLMILAHYNVISDSKSLKLDEFLRRRARLQRVEEEARRRIVVGFFDTIYWSRKFKKHIDRRRNSRMTGVPVFDVPEIIVEGADDSSDPFADGDLSRGVVQPLLSPPEFARETSVSKGTKRTSYFTEVFVDEDHRSSGNGIDLSFRLTLPGNDDAPRPPSVGRGNRAHTDAARSPDTSPQRGRPGTSSSRPGTSGTSYSFDLDMPENLRVTSSALLDLGTSTGVSRERGNSRTSNTSAASANEVMRGFGESAWGESLRRNITQRRSREGAP